MRKKVFFLIVVFILFMALSSAMSSGQVQSVQRSVTAAAPAIFVTNPKANVVWYAGTGQKNSVRWKTSGTFTYTSLNINLCDEAGSRVVLHLVANTPNDQSEGVELPSSLVEGRYTIRVETTDGAVRGSSEPFFIKTSPFILTVPAGDLVRGRTCTIGWSTTQPASLRIAHILLRREGAMVGEWVLARDVPNSGRAEVVIPSGISPGIYRFEIQPGGAFGGMSFLSQPVRIN